MLIAKSNWLFKTHLNCLVLAFSSLFSLMIQQVHTHPVATISSSRERKPNRAPRVTVLLCTTALFLLLERTVEVYIMGTSVAIEQLMLVTVVVE